MQAHAGAAVPVRLAEAHAAAGTARQGPGSSVQGSGVGHLRVQPGLGLAGGLHGVTGARVHHGGVLCEQASARLPVPVGRGAAMG